MLSLGVIGTFIATFFVGLSVTLQKKESMHYQDRCLALVYQYSFVVFWSFIFIGVYLYQSGSSFIPNLTTTERLLIVSMCVIWFIATNLMFTAYRHLNGGVAYILGSVGVFVMYFVNMQLFPWLEALSPIKIAMAVLFFLILVQFIVKRNEWDLKDHHFVNKYTLYAIGASLCWAYFTTTNNYILKTADISPFHILLFVEVITLVLALGWYFACDKGSINGLRKNITRRDSMVFMTIGICWAIAWSIQYYAYQTNPANLINFIKLFSLITTSVLCRLFLNDKLTKKQVCLMGCALAVLITFMLVK